MKGLKLLGILLILAGVLGLVYKGFTYTQETHTADLGPLEFKVKEKKTVDIPVWASAGAVVVGAGLLLVNRQK